MYLDMYIKAMNGMTGSLLKKTRPSGLEVLGTGGWGDSTTMEHLACFVPGMLALGAYYSTGTPLEANKWEHLKHAKALTYTCWQMYERTPTGLAPDAWDVMGLGDPVPNRQVRNAACAAWCLSCGGVCRRGSVSCGGVCRRGSVSSWECVVVGVWVRPPPVTVRLSDARVFVLCPPRACRFAHDVVSLGDCSDCVDACCWACIIEYACVCSNVCMFCCYRV